VSLNGKLPRGLLMQGYGAVGVNVVRVAFADKQMSVLEEVG
jgi:hypothetical protein